MKCGGNFTVKIKCVVNFLLEFYQTLSSSLHYVVFLSFLLIFAQWSMFCSSSFTMLGGGTESFESSVLFSNIKYQSHPQNVNFPSPLELFSPNYDVINRKPQPIEHTPLYENNQNERKMTQWRLLVFIIHAKYEK